MKPNTKVVTGIPVRARNMFVLVLAMSGLMVLPRGTAAHEASVEMNDILRVVISNFQTENPDFKKVSEFKSFVIHKSEIYEADEDALWQLYHLMGLTSEHPLRQNKLMNWLQSDPAETIPLLAPLSGQLATQTGDLRASYFTRASWHATPEMRSNVKRIRAVLIDIKETASRDPQWYTLMAETAVASGTDMNEVIAVASEGVARHPGDYESVVMASSRFLGKWAGDPDSLEAWARLMGEKFASHEGQAMYARIYWKALEAQYQGQLFRLSKVDWPRLMQGLRDLVERHPSVAHLNQAAVLSCLGGNQQLMKELLLHPNFRYEERYWFQLGASDGAYQPCRNWAADAQN